jgi:hypothetical protein
MFQTIVYEGQDLDEKVEIEIKKRHIFKATGHIFKKYISGIKIIKKYMIVNKRKYVRKKKNITIMILYLI